MWLLGVGEIIFLRRFKPWRGWTEVDEMWKEAEAEEETEAEAEAETLDLNGAGITGAFIDGALDKGKAIIAIVFVVLLIAGGISLWIWKKKKMQTFQFSENRNTKKTEKNSPYWQDTMKKITDKKR